jgi:hypothetical protein
MDWNICLERAPGIEIREAPDGLVVYDAGRDRLHYLNPTAALLLESCDGTLPAVELPGLLAAAFNTADRRSRDLPDDTARPGSVDSGASRLRSRRLYELGVVV